MDQKMEDTKSRTGLVLNDIFKRHLTHSGHPESPDRIEKISSALKNAALPKLCTLIEPRKAHDSEILANHSAEYLARLTEAIRLGAPIIDCEDSSICPESLEIARFAAGSVVEAVTRVMSGELHNAFCVVRPPGHHAERGYSMGFCLFNNIAIAARVLTDKFGLERVVVLDWDVHHGNGTQHSFEDDPKVYVMNIHGAPPFYPGDCGYAAETGIGAGAGRTLNLPMEEGSGESEYREAFLGRIVPEIESFRPEFILISAGFDAHKEDPLGPMKLSTEFFGFMTTEIRKLAENHCGGRLVSVLEGGYNTTALGECAVAHLSALLSRT